MKELQEKGEAKTQQEVLNLGVPIKDWQEQQHDRQSKRRWT